MMDVTYGIRWDGKGFLLHLCWFHWKTRQWTSMPVTPIKRYKHLERMLKMFHGDNNGVGTAVMIFPAYEVTNE